jgi:hypothetical protein
MLHNDPWWLYTDDYLRTVGGTHAKRSAQDRAQKISSPKHPFEVPFSGNALFLKWFFHAANFFWILPPTFSSDPSF